MKIEIETVQTEVYKEKRLEKMNQNLVVYETMLSSQGEREKH